MQPRQAHDRRQLVELLRQQIEGQVGGTPIQTGQFKPGLQRDEGGGLLDHVGRLLPRGLRPGTLLEWLAADEGSGAATLALIAARSLCQADGVLVVVDARGDFYPPAAAAWGLDLGRLILVRPGSEADAAWATDQALRCAGVRVVLDWPGRLDNRTFRRWQLAAGTGGGWGLLVRSADCLGEPTWAEARLLVQPVVPAAARLVADGGRQLRVEAVRCRGGLVGGAVHLEIDHETGDVRLAAELAAAATGRRAAGT
jgi:hypothetical protein